MDLCSKVSCKSKSFATLAEDINIWIVWKTSATSKSCSLQQNSLIKAFLIGKDWENTVNNMGVVKKGCTNMCAQAIVNLYKQTKVDLFKFFNMEETFSYGRQTLANFQKIFSMSTEPITVSPPSVRSSYFMSWWTIHGPRYLFTVWVAYTLHSDFEQQITHRSNQMTYVFGIYMCFRKS